MSEKITHKQLLHEKEILEMDLITYLNDKIREFRNVTGATVVRIEMMFCTDEGGAVVTGIEEVTLCLRSEGETISFPAGTVVEISPSPTGIAKLEEEKK